MRKPISNFRSTVTAAIDEIAWIVGSGSATVRENFVAMTELEKPVCIKIQIAFRWTQPYRVSS